MASGVVTALGGDVALTVSFAVASELSDAASLEQMSQVALVSCLLVATTFSAWLTTLGMYYDGGRNGIPAFVARIAAVTHRVALNTLVQVIALIAAATQPRRLVRVLSLIGVAVFFVFLQRVSSMGVVKMKK